MTSTQNQTKHLLWRAGFGPTLESQTQNRQNPAKILRELLKGAQTYRELSVVGRSDFPGLGEIRNMSPEERRELNKQLRQGLRILNHAWIKRMKSSKGQLLERMTFFWHDHFACRLNNVLLAQQQNNVLRKHALGKFGDLLLAISKDPGMLQFLNNQQNRKGHPNENFAREVLELFTMGRGNYTEQDISEAARAFTGWGFNRQAEFVFRRRAHDMGTKSFMGRRGNFDGEDILKIILEQRQTATFLTRKLYRYFVNEEENEEVIGEWAKVFYESEYDMLAMMERILGSTHFYEEKHIGSQIKSPVVFLVGLMRLLDIDFGSEEGPLIIQKMLGQVLLVPPNVAGWPEGVNWIDSGTMMARMKLPQALIFAAEIDMNTKENFAMNEDVMQAGGRRFQKRLQAEINWSPLLNKLSGKSKESIISELMDYVLIKQPTRFDRDWLTQFVRGKTREEQIRMLIVRLVCTPEFQLC